MLSVKSSSDKSLTITKHVSKSTEVILFIGINFILITETFSTAIKIHLNCFLVRCLLLSYVICQVIKR